MKERKADLFKTIYEDGVDAICITTNGMYLKDGRAAMGGGCAKTCADFWPETSIRLGKCLKNFSTNVPFVIGALDKNGKYIEPNMKLIKEHKFKTLILSFPTIDNLIDGAKLDLILNSAKELKIMADRFDLRGIVIGRPGCGIGSLSYQDVKPILEKYFDDRFTIVSFEHED
jgi:hypothetical protein